MNKKLILKIRWFLINTIRLETLEDIEYIEVCSWLDVKGYISNRIIVHTNKTSKSYSYDTWNVPSNHNIICSNIHILYL